MLDRKSAMNEFAIIGTKARMFTCSKLFSHKNVVEKSKLVGEPQTVNTPSTMISLLESLRKLSSSMIDNPQPIEFALQVHQWQKYFSYNDWPLCWADVGLSDQVDSD
jgi:hypothetical protein